MRAVFFALLATLVPLGARTAEPGAEVHAAAAPVYQCPMHPWIRSNHEGQCTVCGMDLVAARNSAEGSFEPGVVALSPSSITTIGVETTLVTRQPLVRTLRVTGRIDDDDTRHRILAARVPGRIEKLGINYLGAEVAAGATLATIYSPEMLTAQRVYLERLKAGGAAYSAAELSAAREQLQLIGLNADDIARLEESRMPSALVIVRAPSAGTVVSKFVYEGQYVQTSDRLFEIGDLTHMWFLFDAYEQDVPWLHVGQRLEITTRAVPGEVIRTRIEFIDPNFSETSRTTKVRAALPNPHYSVGGEPHRIPHRALAEARVLIESAAVLTAPRSAVLDVGLGPIAYVEQGHGRYDQRALQLGRRGDALVEVLDGLKENEKVVTTGALLLDAQAQLSREANRPSPAATPKASPPPPADAALADPLTVLANAAIEAAAALASDDFARYQRVFPQLAPAGAPFSRVPSITSGDSLKAARRSFEPWSTAVADLLAPQRAALGVKIFQCPMAPVLGKGRWVQRNQPLRNPFFGSAMANCGEELPVINWVIKWSLENRFAVLCATLLLFGWGVFAVRTVPVDAIPDLSENQVIVFADWEGRSPREVEDQVTYPLSVNLQGLAGVRTVRATSMFGFSLITVIFEDRLDNYFARTRTLERLNYLGNVLPAGVTPRLGPDATGLGWVYQYYLKDTSGKNDLGSLRALQDYFVRYQLAAVPGVAEVASIGGFVRQWQVEVSSLRLKQYGVSLEQVFEAIARNNLNVGGRTVEENGLEFVVRGRGLINSAGDLEVIALTVRDQAPVYLRDVATVQVGGDNRRGTLDVDGHEVVGGTVVMRSGENAHQVIQDVKAKIAQISGGLPPGVAIQPFYDRSDLISRAIATLKHTLWEAVILVTLMHVIFLFHFRSILIVTLPLPASILVAFILMKEFGIQSHIMSLTGIAIAIGVLVDAAIVMTENVIRRCELEETKLGRPLTRPETWQVTLAASQQVGRPIFFAMGIIILAFVPIFTLTGQEGKLFHPLAWTKTFAMVGATVLAVTLVPVLCTLLVRGPFHAEDQNWVMRGLLALYDPVLDWALRRRKTVLALASALLAACLVIAFGLPERVVTRLAAADPRLAAKLARGFGNEFMPTLQEGSLLFMPVLLPSTSLTEIKRIMAWQDQTIRATPEVASVAGKLGRFDTATDPAPVEMIETTIMLKPPAEWRAGLTKEKLIAELTAKLTQIPGYVPGFLQPIENRVLMLSTGIRAQLGIKIFGNDLDALQQKAFEVERIVKTVTGATGVAPSRVQGKPYLEITADRAALARYGLSAADVLAVAETGLGGRVASTSIQGRERWPIQVRFDRADREDLEKFGALPVALGDGRYVPLGQVATVQRVVGPNEIASENGRLRVFVQTNVTGRDLGGFVDEVRAKVTQRVTLDPGMTIEWSGQYENQIRARQTLQLVMPAVLLIIFLLLTMTFHSPAEAAHVILAVPFALTGGVLLQWWLGYNFSVAVWVGYIALFGTAIQTGVVMVLYLEEAVARKRLERGAAFGQADLLAAIKEGARLRLRPKVMTVATAIAGLLPIFWSTRTGTEVMRPLAAPVVGGMLSSLVHILVVTPVIFAWLRERESVRATH